MEMDEPYGMFLVTTELVPVIEVYYFDEAGNVVVLPSTKADEPIIIESGGGDA